MKWQPHPKESKYFNITNCFLASKTDFTFAVRSLQSNISSIISMAKMTILNREEDFLKDLEKEIMTIKHQMSSETYRIKGWVILTCMIDI